MDLIDLIFGFFLLGVSTFLGLYGLPHSQTAFGVAVLVFAGLVFVLAWIFIYEGATKPTTLSKPITPPESSGVTAVASALLASEVWREFLEEYEKLPVVKERMEWRYWTKQWLGIFERTAIRHELTQKPIRNDASWYDPTNLDPTAAIEVETNEDTIWESEIPNLLYSCARLKVLLTCVTKEREQEFVDRIRESLAKRSGVIDKEEFLAMFVIYHKSNALDQFDVWHAWLFASKKEGSSITVSMQPLPETRVIS